jgi:biotin synthase
MSSAVQETIVKDTLSAMAEPRNDWTLGEIRQEFEQPFNDLLDKAHRIHRRNFDPNEIQVSTLLSIKTGRCPEDCAYCPQSIRYNTGLVDHPLMSLNEVKRAAERARAQGATRFCMGASLRGPKDRDVAPIVEMIKAVKALGMEACVTLGLLRAGQAEALAAAGLDYYNHNLDTSESHYPTIISTRTYQDRLDTLARVREAGVKVCCGGILGLGETHRDRIEFLHALATLPEHPQSVPINRLVPIEGTPLEDAAPLDTLEFVRSIATARVALPRSEIRLSAGRTDFSDEMQALCFFAGANSIFYGDKLLTTDNPGANEDDALFDRLGLRAQAAAVDTARS